MERLITALLFLQIIGNQFITAQPQNTLISPGVNDKSEPSLAIQGNNTSHQMAIWNDFGDGFTKAGWAITSDGWSSSTSGIMSPVPTGWIYGFDPSGFIASDATAYYCYVAAQGDLATNPNSAVYLARSTNNGGVWDKFKVSYGNVYADKSYMAMDETNGLLLFTWTHTDPSDIKILFRYSTNGGTTFEPTDGDVLVHAFSGSGGGGGYPSIDPQTNEGLLHASMPVVGLNLRHHVFYTDPETDELNVKSTSDYSGFPFNPTYSWPIINKRTLWGKLEIFPIPSIATNLARDSGHIYVVYSTTSAHGEEVKDWKLKFVRSTNDGMSWEPPVSIGDINPGIQYFPWITVDPAGIITISFLHSETENDVNVFTIQSRDYGVSFLAAERVTSVT